MVVSYFDVGPGLPLADLVQIVGWPLFGQGLADGITLHAEAQGALRAPFGVPDGTRGRLSLSYRAYFDPNNLVEEGRILLKAKCSAPQSPRKVGLR